VYLADLKPVCGAAARVLELGGLFAFTTETHDGGGVLLGEKLRYAHSADHVRTALEAAGLSVLALAPASPRTEAAVPVSGLVIVAGHWDLCCFRFQGIADMVGLAAGSTRSRMTQLRHWC